MLRIESADAGSQWISEVLHFCQGLPIILVGCKKDLRHDPKTIEELTKTSQKPVTPEQVRFPFPFPWGLSHPGQWLMRSTG
jgi:GTPase SAR1 family protein